MPSIAEQREIVRRVEALFALADKIEGRVKGATAGVEKSTQAILAKAFRGELVPTEAELARQEGRDYEPARALLERIEAQRPSAPKKMARSKTGPVQQQDVGMAAPTALDLPRVAFRIGRQRIRPNAELFANHRGNSLRR